MSNLDMTVDFFEVVGEDVDPFAKESPYDWMMNAVCASVDPELFFPEYQGSKMCNVAKTVCANCPVVSECLEQALRVPAQDDFGVWGNTTPPEREEIRRQRRAAGIDLTLLEFAPLDPPIEDDLPVAPDPNYYVDAVA